MEGLFNSILEMSIKGGFVIVLIHIARVFLAKAPKKFSYMLWSVAAFRLCIPTSFKSVFSVFNIGRDDRSIQQIADTVSKSSVVINDISNTGSEIIIENPGISQKLPDFAGNITSGSQPIIDTSEEALQAIGIIGGAENTAADITKVIAWDLILPKIVALIWIIGMSAMVIYGIVSYIKIWKRMQTAIILRDNIYVSDRTDSPFTIGFISPRIYLPIGLTEDEQQCIIAHEKCHIRRFDHIIKLFAYLLLSVHWFNPLCWIAFSRMSYDMEMSCDEKVFSGNWDEEMKKLYSKTLVAIGTKKRFPAPSPIAFDGVCNTKKRIMNVLNFKKPRFLLKLVCYVLCIIFLVACASDVKENVSDNENQGYSSEESGKEATISNEEAIRAYEKFIEGKRTALFDDSKNDKSFMFQSGESFMVSDLENEIGEGGIDRYAYYDMNSDGINELITDGMTWSVFTYKNGELLCLYSEAVEKYPYILENGALYSYRLSTGNFYSYTTIDTDGKVSTIEFCEPTEDSDGYDFNGRSVTKDEYESLTKDIFEAAESVAELDWVGFGMDEVHSALWDAMESKTEVIDEKGQAVLVRSFDIGKEFDIDSYTYIDMDSDGTEELVAALSDGNGYIILRYVQGKIYGYYKAFQSLAELKTDGSYLCSNGADDQSIYKMSFQGDGTTMAEAEIAKKYESGEKIYRLSGTDAEKQEVEAYFSDWKDNASAEFTEYPLVIKLDYATKEMLDNVNEYVYFLDMHGFNSDWNIVFSVSKTVSNFCFLEIGDAEPKTLFSIEKLTPEMPFLASTYINDATVNRGFSFIDGDGITRFYVIEWSRQDGSIYLRKSTYISDSTSVEFRVDENMPKYSASVEINSALKAYLKVINAESGEEINNTLIELFDSENVVGTAMKPYIIDVTFDGNKDILVPYMSTGHGIYFSAYVWYEDLNQYKYVPHFERISNFVLDYENKRIMAYRQNDMTSYFAYCIFDEDDFIPTNTINFEYIIADGKETVIFRESTYNGGEWTSVSEYTIEGDENYYSVEGLSDVFDSYYKEGSFWDLNSEKWQNFALKDEIYG